MINDRVKGLLMVHYFGQPQEIEKFQSFCNKHGLFLIEDNAHGYGERYKGSKLGTFGDFGISSPRKILKIHSGGVLWLKENKLDNDISLIPYSPSIISYLNVFMDNNYPSLKVFFKKLLKNRPDYEDYKLFREDKINDYMIDFSSKRILRKVNLKRIIKHRQDIYNKWHIFALKNNLTPVFSKIYPNANPWCFPAYVSNHKEAIKWFDWGWKNNEHIFSWPSLPEEVLQKNTKLMNRWEKLVCFGIK